MKKIVIGILIGCISVFVVIGSVKLLRPTTMDLKIKNIIRTIQNMDNMRYEDNEVIFKIIEKEQNWGDYRFVAIMKGNIKFISDSWTPVYFLGPERNPTYHCDGDASVVEEAYIWVNGNWISTEVNDEINRLFKSFITKYSDDFTNSVQQNLSKINL